MSDQATSTNDRKDEKDGDNPATIPVLSSLPGGIPRLDHVIARTLARTPMSGPYRGDSTLVYAAWALLMTRMYNTEEVLFGIAELSSGTATKASYATPFRVSCHDAGSVSSYLEEVEAEWQRQKSIPCEEGQILPKMRTVLVLDDDHGCGQTDGYMDGNRCTDAKLPAEATALVLKLYTQGDLLQCEATFDQSEFEPWLVPLLMMRLEFVMQQLQEYSATTVLVADVSVVSPLDMEQIWEWNGDLPATVHRTMQSVFHDQVIRQPSAPAIDAWDGRFSYADLDLWSDRLAGALIVSGVQPNTIVPLCFEKSRWMPVAMLGVLKAGAAFALLEISFPEQRLRGVVEQVKADTILCSQQTAALSRRLSSRVLQVDETSIESVLSGCSPTTRSPSTSEVMFAVFTSGSTGSPKVATLTHSNYASALAYQLKPLGFTKTSRVFDFASYAFDVSVHNVFATLASGGCLCIPSDEDRRNNIAKVMADMRVTIAQLTPSVTRLLTPEDVPELKTMVFTGEPLPVQEAARWWGKVDIVNEYGPAECTINTINSNAGNPKDATRLGSPVGAVAWIVDPDDANILVPVGCVGELLIEGPLVGQGYLHNAEKNAASFVQDPKWLLQGTRNRAGRTGRMFKTGDLVRYHEDGSLSIYGRKDVQVKIHGQRVDLDEVEHCVRSSLDHADTVVAEGVYPRHSNPAPSLVAFVQGSHEVLTEAREARDHGVYVEKLPLAVQRKLEEYLPTYSIPTRLFWLDQIPITPTGKTDRKTLRELGSSLFFTELADNRAHSQDHNSVKGSFSDMERKVQQIWGQVLELDPDQIQSGHDFIHMGGDSIAAMKAVGVARGLGVHMTVADIFRHRTLRELAAHCEETFESDSRAIQPFELLGAGVNGREIVDDIARQYELEPEKIVDVYPCTRLQEGFMFLSSKRPGEYMEQRILELAPDLSVEHIRRAVETAVEAVPIFRTRIVDHERLGLLQLVYDDEATWTEVPGLDEYISRDRRRAMSLGGPLSRFALVQDVSKTLRWLVWTVHHALYDGWSIYLMVDAIERAHRGEGINVGPQFQTFIKYIQSQDNEKAFEYWRSYLDDFDGSAFPQLSPSGREPVVDSVVRTTISSPRTHDAITISTQIRAAWALVIGQMARSNDVAFGTTLYGRNAAADNLEDLIAPTIATVPVRIRLSRQQTVLQYLETVQQQATEMMPYEQTGLANIGSLSLSAKRASQFQNFLIIQPNEPDFKDGVLGKWQTTRSEQWLSTYGLTLELRVNQGESIAASATFDSRLVEPWIVNNMLQRLDRALDQLSGNPSQLLDDIDLLTPEDLEQVWKWNESVPERVDRCIHDLLSDNALSRPQSPAICSWDGDLTYRGLDDLSDQLARHLYETGAAGTTHALIPLCFEKSLWTPVAMLGTVKANAGFILLDPNLPEHRLQAIVQQVGATVIVTSRLQHTLSSNLASETIVLDGDLFARKHLEVQRAEKLPPVDPSSVAYAIFTSGTSGTPKGVMVSHANAVSAVHHQLEAWSHDQDTRLLDFCSYSFDVAIGHFLGILGGGGCLCIPSEEQRKTQLVETINKLHVNSLVVTPSVARLLAPPEIPGVRVLAIGAESLQESDLQTWQDRVRLRNVYGPSECTPVSVMNTDLRYAREPNTIGRGVGAVTWIVDPEDHNKLLGLGCTGELLLEGPIVGLGYLGDPIKTKASFVHDPVWLLKGSKLQPGRSGRLYKTGDLVRYNREGDLIFVGRNDSQVKIRGQRVEIKEIEEVLRSLQEVKEAAVVVVENGNGRDKNSWLAGFMTAHEDNSFGRVDDATRAEQVQSMLRVHLPSYMIPESIQILDKFPLTNNGKTDRSVLAERAVRSPVSAHGVRRPPSTAAERLLQSIWSQALSIEPSDIAMDDGFTQLGGDSLLAMRVIKLAQKAGLSLSLEDMFRHSKTSINVLCKEANDSPKSSTVDCLMADILSLDEHIASAQACSIVTSADDRRHRDEKLLTVALTGANGFIGTQVLRQLLEHSRVGRVIAIGRGSSPDNSRQRIVDAAIKAQWWTQSFDHLEVWQGDLALPQLGVTEEHWQVLLAGRVDVLVLNGAEVHFLKSYAALKAANVDSTVQMLSIATRQAHMRLVYVSSARPENPEEDCERDVAERLATLGSGYSQTKYVSEALVRRAARRGPAGKFAVVSPGLVVGTPAEGIANADDWIWRMAAACIRVGCYNQAESNRWIPISDATVTAHTVVQKAILPSQTDRIVTQIVGGLTIGEFWAILERSGWRVQGTDAEAFVKRIREDVTVAGGSHPLGALTDEFIETGGVLDREEWADSWHGSTCVSAASVSSSCSSLGPLETAVSKSAETLMHAGFLPPPSTATSSDSLTSTLSPAAKVAAFQRSSDFI